MNRNFFVETNGTSGVAFVAIREATHADTIKTPAMPRFIQTSDISSSSSSSTARVGQTRHPSLSLRAKVRLTQNGM
jgi:hypothetical protein